MRILVLGGTRFVGRAIVDQAISHGHDVTTFTRGLHGGPRAGAVALHGDRTRPADVLPLADQDWDAVIDTSIIAPAHVAESARILADRAGRYVYVSSLAVYSGRPREPVTEESATHECSPDATGSEESLGYGPLKAGSERAVVQAFAGRHLIVRPGLIAGPHDDVGRVPWWLARLALGGRVLAPGSPGRPVRLTDARDLASWILDSARRKITGTVNVPGPRGYTFGDLLDLCAHVVGGQAGMAAGQTGAARGQAGAARGQGGPAADLIWVPDQVLLAARVKPYTELPMWVPDIPELAGIWEASGERARQAGVRYRSLADTVRDTWGWLSSDAAARDRPVTDFERHAGIGLDRTTEQQILAGL